MSKTTRTPRTVDPGYRAPDEQPETFVCARVYVPDDTLHIAAFWGAVETLTKWIAWERGGSKARDAAAVWKLAWEMSRAAWEECNRECGIVDIRQSLSQPCLIEKKIDCSTWVTAVDMRACVPKMRIRNGLLEQDITGEGDWEPAGNPTDPYDPRTDGYAEPPWTDPPAGESGECLSAVNVATYVDFVAYQFAASMVNGLTFFQTLSAAMVILTALMGLIPLTALTALVTALYEQVVDSWEDVRDVTIISKLTELMACKFNSDGSMTESQFDALIEVCNDHRDTLTDPDERAKWFIAIATMTLWGPVGMTLSGKIWGITTYECTYNECEWEHTFDFSESQNGWNLDDLFALVVPGTSGAYTESGFVHTSVTETGNHRANDCSIDVEFTSTSINRIRVTFELTKGTYGASVYGYYCATGTNTWRQLVWYYDLVNGETVADISFTPAVVDRIRVALRSSYNSWTGSILIKSVTVNGTGTNPFI